MSILAEQVRELESPVPEPGAFQVARPLRLPGALPPGPTTRGQMVEPAVVQQRYPGATQLPGTHPSFDAVQGGRISTGFASGPGGLRRWVRIEGGQAVSVKSIDTSGRSYATADGTVRALGGYVDAAAGHPHRGQVSISGRDPSGAPVQHTVVNPDARVLHLELTGRPTPAQMDGFARLRKMAADKGVELRIVSPSGAGG